MCDFAFFQYLIGQCIHYIVEAGLIVKKKKNWRDNIAENNFQSSSGKI